MLGEGGIGKGETDDGGVEGGNIPKKSSLSAFGCPGEPAMF